MVVVGVRVGVKVWARNVDVVWDMVGVGVVVVVVVVVGSWRLR